MNNEKIVEIFEALGFSNKYVYEDDGIVRLFYDTFLDELVADDEFVQKNLEYFKNFKLEVILDSSAYFSIRLNHAFDKNGEVESDVALSVMKENFGLRGAKIVYYEGEDFYRLISYRNFKVSELSILLSNKIQLFLRGFVLTCLERMARVIYSISKSEHEPIDYSIDRFDIVKISDLDRDRSFYIDSFKKKLIDDGVELLKYDFATVIFKPTFLKGQPSSIVTKFFPEYGLMSFFLILGDDPTGLDVIKVNELNSKLKFGKLEISPQKDRLGIQFECFLSSEIKDDFEEFDFGLEVLSVFYNEYLKMRVDEKVGV